MKKNSKHATPMLLNFSPIAVSPPGKIREHASKMAVSAAMAGTMLFAQPLAHQVASHPETERTKQSTEYLQKELADLISGLLPKNIEPLTPAQESEIEQKITSIWGINAKASLQGEKLNQSYGYMGAEQHLARYPGDSVPNMATGRGAWGYFANSKGELTQDLIQKEKWYVAVQTLYLPDWQTRLPYLREWYKYREVLVVNPANGKTVVAVIADSGPANFTGKHFGGSPEVMEYLGLRDGRQKSGVILFFVDDPNHEIPLGPVEYNVKVGAPYER